MAVNISCVGIAFLLLTLASSIEARVLSESTLSGWGCPCPGYIFSADSDGYSTQLQAPLGSWVMNNSGQYQVRAHPVLYVQQPQSKPPMWLFQELRSWGLERTNLPLRSDNLNLVAFATAAGHWYAFEGQQHLIPGAISLGFDGSYESLLGEGGWRNLEGMAIGRTALMEAIQTLASYDPASTPEAVIKDALATVQVMVIEAVRFPHVRGAVARAWEDGGALDRRSATLVGSWRTISCAVLIWNVDGLRWDSDEAVELADPQGLRINSVEEALGNVGPLLQPRYCSVQYWRYH